MLKNESLTLQKDDVMLLYTDGITEAWQKESRRDKRDIQHDIFGDERLLKLLKNNGNRDAESIIKAICDELKGYEYTDDITMMTLKRLA